MNSSRTIPIWVDRFFDGPIQNWISARPIFCLALIMSVGLMGLGWKFRARDRAEFLPEAFIKFLVAGGLASAAVLGLHYLTFPKFADHGEAHVVAMIAWLWRGGELYATDGLRDYSNLYGPYAYILPGLISELGMWLSRGSWIFTKIPGAMAGAGGLAMIYLGLRRQAVASRGALLALAFTASIALSYGGVLYWSRPDPWVFLMAATLYTAALYLESPGAQSAAKTWRAAGCYFVIGIAMGTTVGIKLHAGIYLLPALWLVWRRRGLLGLGVAAVLGTLVFLLPFATPAADLVQHLSMLKYAAGQFWDWSSFRIYFLPGAIAICIPLILSRIQSSPAFYGVGRVTLLSAVLGAIMAAKPGAGFYQLFPLLPATVLGAAPWWRRSVDSVGVRWITVLLLIAWIPVWVPNQYAFFRQTRGYARVSVLPAIEETLREYDPRTLAVGWGDNSTYDSLFLSFYRYRAIRAGGPYFYDLSSRMESEFSGVPAPVGDLVALRECRVRTWLIPRDEKPFGFLSWYTGRPIYSAEFRDLFARNYSVAKVVGPFDVWVCRFQFNGSKL